MEITIINNGSNSNDGNYQKDNKYIMPTIIVIMLSMKTIIVFTNNNDTNNGGHNCMTVISTNII